MTTTAFPSRHPVRVKDLQGASRALDVQPIDPQHGRYIVSSATHVGAYYRVALDADGLGGTCTCLWGQHGGANCKHVLAALREHYASEGQLSFWSTLSAAQRQHRRLVRGHDLYGTLRRA